MRCTLSDSYTAPVRRPRGWRSGKSPIRHSREGGNPGSGAAALALGGLPIVVDGEVIGGIGASFATPEDDEQVARAGLAALSKQLESGACFGP